MIDTQMPVVMGIINLTPDSFYTNSRITSIQGAVDLAGLMLGQGAEILDLGAMSTRPGSQEISPDEELERLVPAYTAIRKAFPAAFISIDTYRASIAKELLRYGADMINDISGGTFDEELPEVVSAANVPYVLMHTGGKPRTMQENPVYQDVVAEVYSYLKDRINILTSAGIRQLILDPGFGFGKTVEHNYRLLAGLKMFRELGYPLLAGVSRKSMINKILGTTPKDALNGTTVLNTIALLNEADILRVHDVKEAVECKRLILAYKDLGRFHC